ncbi:hypothetical protein JOE21_001313 [Desmospora profundinema]|uniref:Transposase n=2 Tax=Desmospora profundinema TaxID=1571184 RepID=A0ABU1IL87_9BACL|nr:hypothetical protein [Desmospora profundinema]
MPSHYGSPVTCWRRLNQWSEDGTWEQIWQALLQQMDEQQKLDWTKAFLDGSFVPAKKGRENRKNQGWYRKSEVNPEIVPMSWLQSHHFRQHLRMGNQTLHSSEKGSKGEKGSSGSDWIGLW